MNLVMHLLLIAFCAALVALTAFVLRKSIPGDMVIDVPFDFLADGHELAAGRYIVKAVDPAHVRIFNSQTNGLYLWTHSAVQSSTDSSQLLFHRYGGIYFLAAIWIAGNRTGRELFRSRAERELAHRKPEMELAVIRPLK